jgi:hypothetical protein
LKKIEKRAANRNVECACPVDDKELPSTPSTIVRHDGRWASADTDGTQSNAARARREFKIERKKESSNERKKFQKCRRLGHNARRRTSTKKIRKL